MRRRTIDLCCLTLILRVLCAAIGPVAVQAEDVTKSKKPCEADRAKDAVEQFRKDLKANKPEDAVKLLARFPKLPEEYYQRQEMKLARHAKRASEGDYDFSVIEAKTSDQCAVVIINEDVKQGRRSIDYDPVFLLLQEGKWRILPGLTQYDREEFSMDDATKKRFAKLENWFEERTRELKRR